MSAMRFQRINARNVVFAVIAFALSGCAAVSAAAGYFAAKAPMMAQLIDPGNGEAAGLSVVLRQAAGGERYRLTSADKEVLRRGLRRDPLSPEAVRAFGLDAYIGNTGKARPLMELTDRISRRDAGAQVWLVYDNVKKGDSRAAMKRIDTALSVSPSISPMIFPILTKALSDPSIDADLGPRLRFDRPWADDFILYATSNVANPRDLGRLMRAARPLPPSLRTDVLLHQIVDRYVAEADVAGARSFAIDVVGTKASTLDDPSLTSVTTDPNLTPLTWSIPANGSIVAELTGADLQLLADPGATGVVLSRSIALAPGVYELSHSVSYPQGGAPASFRWEVKCYREGAPRENWSQVIPARPSDAKYEMRFTVPSGCPAVQIALSVRETDRSSSAVATIGDIRIARAGAR